MQKKRTRSAKKQKVVKREYNNIDPINQMGPNEQCVFIKQEAASGIVLFPAAGV